MHSRPVRHDISVAHVSRSLLPQAQLSVYYFECCMANIAKWNVIIIEWLCMCCIILLHVWALWRKHCSLHATCTLCSTRFPTKLKLSCSKPAWQVDALNRQCSWDALWAAWRHQCHNLWRSCKGCMSSTAACVLWDCVCSILWMDACCHNGSDCKLLLFCFFLVSCASF